MKVLALSVGRQLRGGSLLHGSSFIAVSMRDTERCDWSNPDAAAPMGRPCPAHLAPSIPLRQLSRLLCPGQRGAVAQIENRHRRPLASVDQSLQYLGRKTGQPQLATDVPIMASLPQN